ncbi:MAG: hypothetical protein ACRDRS_07455 [Pseudonocardiaceae bacterium]
MTNSLSPRRAIRDRDYLLDRHGVIFKVIGDVHPDGHHLGYVKYHPDPRGDRKLFGQAYRQNTVVSKSFGILADRPECYLYSPVLGCVITGLPRQDIATHYSCRQALAAIHDDPGRVHAARAGEDLLAILTRIIDAGVADLFGVTGSFLVGCFNARSDIDLVCYGQARSWPPSLTTSKAWSPQRCTGSVSRSSCPRPSMSLKRSPAGSATCAPTSARTPERSEPETPSTCPASSSTSRTAITTASVSS